MIVLPGPTGHSLSHNFTLRTHHAGERDRGLLRPPTTGRALTSILALGVVGIVLVYVFRERVRSR